MMSTMIKYIIVGIIVIISILFIGFLVQNRGTLNKEFTEIGSGLSITPETKTITNLDNKKVTKEMTSAILYTNKGNITIEFFKKQAPKTVVNFVKLAEAGFYDGTKFHRVIKGFMIQGGDPLSKDDSKISLWGTGGPGYKFADEISKDNKNNLGTIAMANSGPNTNGSQFFINTAANNFLDAKHTVFGKVVLGMDIVTQIENTPTGVSDRPVNPVIINRVELK